MNRRGFIKRLAALPLIGPVVAVMAPKVMAKPSFTAWMRTIEVAADGLLLGGYEVPAYLIKPIFDMEGSIYTATHVIKLSDPAKSQEDQWIECNKARGIDPIPSWPGTKA